MFDSSKGFRGEFRKNEAVILGVRTDCYSLRPEARSIEPGLSQQKGLRVDLQGQGE